MIEKICMVLIFVGVAVGVGIYCRRHTGTVDGFILGGRNVGPWLSAFAFGTSYFFPPSYTNSGRVSQSKRSQRWAAATFTKASWQNRTTAACGSSARSTSSSLRKYSALAGS